MGELSDLFNLSGRVAIVTGALGQLGPMWISGILEAGATVVGVDRAEAAVSDRFAELQKQYGDDRLILMRADIRERDEIDKLCSDCTAAVGAPSILVNNAGIDQPPNTSAPQYRFDEIPAEEFRRVIDVNLFGTFQMTQVIGSAMARAGRGSIINIGSMYASIAPDMRMYDHLGFDPPFLKPPAYGASKAAVVNLTRYLAGLWGPAGVRVNALSPGGVLGGQDETFKRKFTERVPLRRMAVERDLVAPMLFLASDASAYVTGINLQVDGGFMVW